MTDTSPISIDDLRRMPGAEASAYARGMLAMLQRRPDLRKDFSLADLAYIEQIARENGPTNYSAEEWDESKVKRDDEGKFAGSGNEPEKDSSKEPATPLHVGPRSSQAIDSILDKIAAAINEPDRFKAKDHLIAAKAEAKHVLGYELADSFVDAMDYRGRGRNLPADQRPANVTASDLAKHVDAWFAHEKGQHNNPHRRIEEYESGKDNDADGHVYPAETMEAAKQGITVAELRKQYPKQYAYDAEEPEEGPFAYSPEEIHYADEGRWVTMGAQDGEGGSKVFIRDGKIEKGAEGLVGKKVSELSQRSTKEKTETTVDNTADAGKIHSESKNEPKGDGKMEPKSTNWHVKPFQAFDYSSGAEVSLGQKFRVHNKLTQDSTDNYFDTQNEAEEAARQLNLKVDAADERAAEWSKNNPRKPKVSIGETHTMLETRGDR